MRVENRKQSLFMARKKFLILLVCLGMILTSCGGAGSGNVRTDSVNANGVSPTYSVSSKKKCFNEMPDIETPDSRMTDVEFITDFDEGQYCYALGFDGDKAKNYCIDYFAYLMSQGFSIDDVTDMVGQEGSVAYFIKENDVIVGNIAVTYIDDIGFIMAIWWD